MRKIKFPPRLESLDNLQNSRIKKFVRTSIFTEAALRIPQTSKFIGFTLPGTSFELERKLTQYYRKYQLFGVESNKKIYPQVISERNKFAPKMIVENTTDLEFWKNTKQKFNFIWLDYCGPWRKSKHQSIEIIMERRIFNQGVNYPGVLGITLMVGMEFQDFSEIENVAIDLKNSRGKNTKYDIRISGIPRLINTIANKYDQSIRPVQIFKYRDKARNRKAVPMLMFICEVYPQVINFDVWNTDITGLLLDNISDDSYRY